MKDRILLFLFAVLTAPVAYGQANLSVTARVGAITTAVFDGSSVELRSDGREASAIVTLTAATTPVVISQVAITGGADFTIVSAAPLPATLSMGGALSFSVRYRPTSGRASTGLVTVSYSEGGISRALGFSFVGTAPEYSFSVATPGGPRVPVTSGSRIAFPSTRVGSTVTQTLFVTNTGTGPGLINSVGVTGTGFTGNGTQSQTLPVNGVAAIPITFSPVSRGASTGVVTVDVGGAVLSFGLDGLGAAPEYVVSYSLRNDGNVRPLGNDTKLTFLPTPALTTGFADVAVTNQGNGPGTLSGVVVTGSGFQIAGLPLLPLTIEAGATARFQVVFNPRQLGTFTGSMRIQLDDRSIVSAIEGSTASPDFGVSYVDPVSRNTLPLPDGGTLSFPATVVNSSSTYTIVVRNRGEGTGFVNSVAVGGGGFQLVDLPALPQTLAPGAELRVGVAFSPAQRSNFNGVLLIGYSSGTAQFTLSGSGIGSDLMLEYFNEGGEPVRLTPNTEFTLSTSVGQTATRTIRLTNSGNAEAEVAAIVATGSAWTVANLPFLPVRIPSSGSRTFDLVFSPTEAGTARGRLRINESVYELTGTGVGPRLQFSYSNEAGTTELESGGSIVLTPARVGESSSVLFSVRNTGTSALVLSTVDITAGGASFAVENEPVLPRTIEAGSELRFLVRFRPNNIGALAGTLRLNNASFALSGSGRVPVAIPDQVIEGPSGVQAPMQQPAIRLSLSQPYPLSIRGSLTLSFTSEVFSENPAVQFASGGRVANFVIPANTTRAVFDNQSTEVRLQTGTVAGSLRLRSSFATQAGLDLTPETPASLSISVNRAAPQILSADIASRGATSAVIVLTGFSTTRTLRQVTIGITPRGSARFTTNSVGVNVESAALVWFSSLDSQSLGGLFSMSIPLSFSREGSTSDLTQYIQSLNVTVSNDVGASPESVLAF